MTTTSLETTVVLSGNHETMSVKRMGAEALTVRLAQLLLIAWMLLSVVHALKAAFWFDGYPVNGPFQLYDPLRRIAAGQRAGQDFQFFHGIGVPFLHYPLFKLFGGHSLVASELSRQFTSLTLFVLTLWAFVHVTFRRSAARWMAAAGTLLILEALFRHSAEPGHSLVSGRSAFPLLAFALLQLRISQNLKALLTGVCIACAFLFGTEHGLSLSLSLLAVTAYTTVQSLLSRPRSLGVLFANLRFVFLTLATAGLCAAALLLAFCGVQGARNALHYNLVELPADQFWFFSSPPMPYLHSWRQLLFDHHVVLCFLPTGFILAVLVFLLIRNFRTPLRLGADWRSLAAIMLVYAALTATPLLGILSRHYTYPQARVFVFFLLLVIAEFSRLRRPGFLTIPRWCASALSVICLLTSATLLIQAGSTANQLARHWQNNTASFDRTLDTHWDHFMASATRVIEEHRTRPVMSLWSEYVALLDAHYGTFQPAEDYIIHTVGPDRWHHYIDTFRATNPEFVKTMSPQFSFAEWLQDERWEFYEEILNNYQPLAEVEHDTIWQRNAGPWIYPSSTFQELAVSRKGSGTAVSSSMLPASPEEQIAVVKVHYRVLNPWKKLPLLGATPRYLILVDGTPRNGAVSLPPYSTEFQFPVKLSAAKPVTLHFQIDSLLPQTDLHVESVSYKLLARQPGLSQMFAPRLVPSRY